MIRKWVYTLVVLMAGAVGLQAQEHAEKVDTTVIKPRPFPVITGPMSTSYGLPYFPILGYDPVESKEEKAARINQETYLRVMESVRYNLSPYMPAHLSPAQVAALFVGGLFLNSPYRFRPGTVPVMNATNPFMYAVTPGMAPYAHPYSPDVFPQAIRTELDFTSGTYKQVMEQWDRVQNSVAKSFDNPVWLQPVPRMRYNNSIDNLIP